MTRADTQEAIGNLEYLLVNHYSPEKREVFEQLLQDLRRQLLAPDKFVETN